MKIPTIKAKGDMSLDLHPWYISASSGMSIIALYEQMMGKKMNVHFGGRAYKEREVMVPYKHYNVLPNWNAKVMINKGLALLSMGGIKS